MAIATVYTALLGLFLTLFISMVVLLYPRIKQNANQIKISIRNELASHHSDRESWDVESLLELISHSDKMKTVDRVLKIKLTYLTTTLILAIIVVVSALSLSLFNTLLELLPHLDSALAITVILFCVGLVPSVYQVSMLESSDVS